MMVDTVLDSLAYIPGTPTKKPELLSRYLPPIPDGVVSQWLLQNIPEGSWVLDPFCASPRIAIEAAKAGYRVFVTANNPISRFLLEIAANPPSFEDLNSALSELAASYKGEERIEPHIRSLYNTHCSRCGQIVSADAFLWEQGSATPYARVFTCPYCGEAGEHPTTSFDNDRLKQFQSGGLHKARALERVVAANDQDRIHVEQALSVYLPRALYALLTIINKIEALTIPASSQNYLTALLLYTFDQSNVMWRIPSTRERRRQLNIPRQFRENNIWLSLEKGIDLLSNTPPDESPKVSITTWPDLPAENKGICVYEGRLSSIISSLEDLQFSAVCAAIPRPNQAFWTLSALWSGWLWGREAVGTFKSVLHRQRYDWAWHTTALASIFKQLENKLIPSTPIFGVMGEIEVGFITSTLIAADYAGLDIQGISIRNEEAQAQFIWKRKPVYKSENPPGSSAQIGSQSAKLFLEERGEPGSYISTLSAAIIPILRSKSGLLDETANKENNSIQRSSKLVDSSSSSEPSPSLMYTRFLNSARDALSFRSGFLHFNIQDLTTLESAAKAEPSQSALFPISDEQEDNESNQNSPPVEAEDESEPTSKKDRVIRTSDISESDLIWLRDSLNTTRKSNSDRLEIEIMNYLIGHPGSTFEEIDQLLCGKYRGLFTPDTGFIRTCILSYGEESQGNTGHWTLRYEDMPNVRQSDLDDARRNLNQIGERLGFTINDHLDGDIASIAWKNSSGEILYRFFPTVFANVGEIVFRNLNPISRSFIVLPGSRAHLIVYKLRRDPRIKRAFDPTVGNWQFLKFRHIKSMVENPILSRDNLDQIINLDPLTFSTPQLRLI